MLCCSHILIVFPSPFFLSVQARVREALVNLLNTCGQRVGLPKSPSVSPMENGTSPPHTLNNQILLICWSSLFIYLFILFYSYVHLITIRLCINYLLFFFNDFSVLISVDLIPLKSF